VRLRPPSSRPLSPHSRFHSVEELNESLLAALPKRRIVSADAAAAAPPPPPPQPVLLLPQAPWAPAPDAAAQLSDGDGEWAGLRVLEDEAFDDATAPPPPPPAAQQQQQQQQQQVSGPQALVFPPVSSLQPVPPPLPQGLANNESELGDEGIGDGVSWPPQWSAAAAAPPPPPPPLPPPLPAAAAAAAVPPVSPASFARLAGGAELLRLLGAAPDSALPDYVARFARLAGLDALGVAALCPEMRPPPHWAELPRSQPSRLEALQRVLALGRVLPSAAFDSARGPLAAALVAERAGRNLASARSRPLPGEPRRSVRVAAALAR
jgi:hypothetical protein